MTPPCKNCPDRRTGCHGECEQYLAYRAEREAVYADRISIRNASDARSATYLKWERKNLNSQKRKGK